MPEFNPRRLTLARKRRGYTKAALAELTNVSSRIVTAYERGEKEPGPPSLERIASLLDFPSEFFSGPDLDEPPIDGTSFRALSSLTASQRDQAHGAGAIALALSDWVGQRFRLPASEIPQYQGVDPETAAMSVRSEWGLGERPISNVLHLLEAHGVRVFSLSEDCRELDAFSFWRGETPFVLLNTMKSGEHSRMDAAHELGHLVLHWRGDARGREAEREAQLFGSAFLMPKGSILADAQLGAPLSQLISIKQHWRVSVAALVYRMHAMKMLTDWQYRSYMVEISSRGYRTTEPNPVRPETSQVLGKVFDALRREGVTKKDVAQQLAIRPNELDRTIFGLVLTQLIGGSLGDPRGAAARGDHPKLRIV